MRKIVWVLPAVVVVSLAARARHRAGRLKGVAYHLSRRHPDPNVDHNVLADRIRSALGPLEARLDIPHVHVMVEGHVALLHGDVVTEEQAHEIEAAVEAVSGVQGVESYLHVGLLRSDTRPSEGRSVRAPSEALRRLLAAASYAGTTPDAAPRAVATVLATFAETLPADERRQLLAHLPEDVRRIAALPRRLGLRLDRSRTAAELLDRVAATGGIDAADCRRVVEGVLGTVREFVPEEAGDVAAVLPQELKSLWHAA